MPPICPYSHSLIHQIPTRCRTLRPALETRRKAGQGSRLPGGAHSTEGQLIQQLPCDEAHTSKKTGVRRCGSQGGEGRGFLELLWVLVTAGLAPQLLCSNDSEK